MVLDHERGLEALIPRNVLARVVDYAAPIYAEETMLLYFDQIGLSRSEIQACSTEVRSRLRGQYFMELAESIVQQTARLFGSGWTPDHSYADALRYFSSMCDRYLEFFSYAPPDADAARPLHLTDLLLQWKRSPLNLPPEKLPSLLHTLDIRPETPEANCRQRLLAYLQNEPLKLQWNGIIFDGVTRLVYARLLGIPERELPVELLLSERMPIVSLAQFREMKASRVDPPAHL